jgi:Family of unknown function (DUF6496)
MPKDFKGVMHEWKEHELHSGSKKGPVVKNKKQAEAIAFSEQKKLSGKKDHLSKAMGKVGGGY